MRRQSALLALAFTVLGCQSGSFTASPPFWRSSCAADSQELEVYRRAEAERLEFFEREIKRLRDDLARAEASIVAMESGLRGSQSRADAVSALAEARIALDRVSKRVPWRRDRVEEARRKLDDARRQLDLDHVGAAVFFASRAQGITESLVQEADQVANWPALRVSVERLNLRSGPSREHPVVTVLEKETPVLPERGEGDWTLVRTPAGQVGWVHAPLLVAP